MSYVTNLMIEFDIMEESETKRQLFEFFADKGRILCLSDCDDPPDETLPEANWGGRKWPECSLYGGAYNYLSLDSFWQAVKAISWEYPENLQVFIHDQEDSRFAVWRYQRKTGEWRELVESCDSERVEVGG